MLLMKTLLISRCINQREQVRAITTLMHTVYSDKGFTISPGLDVKRDGFEIE